MLKRFVILLTLSGAAGALCDADNESPLQAVYKSAAELMATVTNNAQARPDQATAPIVNTDHYRINIVRREAAGTAMAHASGPAKGSEVHYIIDGAATVVTGGVLVRPSANGAGGVTIEGGESRRVAKGDVIFIPAGTPHWYKDVDGSVTYLEVRFDVELKK
jgi:mannose-6-phosphate isomerase-like protein (cupin superfamily)